MNIAELKSWISSNFWKSEQITEWVERYFYRRASYISSSTGAAQANLPVKTNSDGYVDLSLYQLQADARYGQLAAANSWTNNNSIQGDLLLAKAGGAEYIAIKIDNTSTIANQLATILFEHGSANRQAAIKARLYPSSQGTELSFWITNSGGTFSSVATLDRDGILSVAAGINFGQDTLNQYDEGTWTPTVAFGGSSSGVTYSARTGTFTRIGNRVMCSMFITLSNNGTGTGDFTITGLPFTSAAFVQMFLFGWSSSSTAFVSVLGHIAASATAITVLRATAATASPGIMQDTETGNTLSLRATFTYQV